jgi:hypothetical protein
MSMSYFDANCYIDMFALDVKEAAVLHRSCKCARLPSPDVSTLPFNQFKLNACCIMPSMTCVDGILQINNTFIYLFNSRNSRLILNRSV